MFFHKNYGLIRKMNLDKQVSYIGNGAISEKKKGLLAFERLIDLIYCSTDIQLLPISVETSTYM
jgi:hypothetical protein